MRSVSVIGIGQTPAGIWPDRTPFARGAASLAAALRDAGMREVQALYVTSEPAGAAPEHEGLALAVAGAAGLAGADVRLVAASCGGGAALHMAVQAVAAGVHDVAAVTGVGKAAAATPAESPDEAALGLTAAGLCALIMRRYMYEYGCQHDDFATFVTRARSKAFSNAQAMMHETITTEAYRQARLIADPVTTLDMAPSCDGAATVVLCATDMAASRQRRPLRVTASDVARDTVALHDRADVLWLQGAYDSARAAYAQAGITVHDIDLFEPHDSFTIMAALSLEAAGFAARGDGVRLAQAGMIARRRSIPMSTMGGLLGRGNAGAASGVYQAVEVALQLRGEAGANQVDGARVGMAQSMGGPGACVTTHILEI